jgi:dynein heavy chain
LERSASAGSDGGDAQSSQQVAEAAIQDILDQYRDTKFELDQISGSVEEVGPFQNIVLQECERMNALISEIVRSLVELDLGFRGELTVSDKMDDLATSLFLDRVPKGWETLAWPSLRGLALWLSDFAARIAQLNDWAASPGETPVVTWISGLFNPQSFLTAVMQTTAQKDNLELDKLTLVTDITKKMLGEEMTTVAKEGTYIVGLKLEGGSWNLGSGLLEPSKPREMYTPLPVVNVKPQVIEKFEPGLFQCPCYKTQSRGPTYVFSLQLRTKADPAKWVLAGVVAVMDVI